MTKQDFRNALLEEPFSYRQFKNGKILISWKNKEIMILKGKKADKFSSQMDNADDFEAQMIMAKITGNFKHGNERDGKLVSK